LVIDGIEELESEGRRVALAFLKSMQQSQTGVRLFITSPPEIDLAATFNNCLTIYVDCSNLGADLEVFVNTRIENASTHGSLSNAESALLDTIKQVLVTKAEGM